MLNTVTSVVCWSVALIPLINAAPSYSVRSRQSLASRDVGAFTYSGCYTEATNARALTGKSFFDDLMTLEKCAAACSEFEIFGVEYGRECYCGNGSLNPGSVSRPDTDCSFNCPGNAAQKCGAGDRLNVYSKGGLLGSPPSPSPSPSPPTSTSYTAKGCWTEPSAGGRALTAKAYYDDGMTLEKCAAACTGYAFFGVEYRRECFCGNTIAPTSYEVNSFGNCKYSCPGNPSQTCGGDSRLNLFAFGESGPVVSSSTTSTPPASTTAPSTSLYTPDGCYTEATGQRALTGYAYYDDLMTVQKCEAACSGFTWFGVEYGRECFCGNTINAGSVKTELSECSFSCPGNQLQKCGAGNRLNMYVYVTPAASSSSTYSSSTTSVASSSTTSETSSSLTSSYLSSITSEVSSSTTTEVSTSTTSEASSTISTTPQGSSSTTTEASSTTTEASSSTTSEVSSTTSEASSTTSEVSSSTTSEASSTTSEISSSTTSEASSTTSEVSSATSEASSTTTEASSSTTSEVSSTTSEASSSTTSEASSTTSEISSSTTSEVSSTTSEASSTTSEVSSTTSEASSTTSEAPSTTTEASSSTTSVVSSSTTTEASSSTTSTPTLTSSTQSSTSSPSASPSASPSTTTSSASPSITPSPSTTTSIPSSSSASSTTSATPQCQLTGQRVTNPSFEMGDAPWTSAASGAITWSSFVGQARSGARSARVRSTGGGTSITVSQIVTICPNRSYTLSAYARQESGPTCTVTLLVNGITLITSTPGAAYGAVGAPTFSTAGSTVTVTVALRVTCGGGGSAMRTVYIDDVSLL